MMKGSLESLALMDMNKVNTSYKKILDLPEGLNFLVSSEQALEK